MTAGLPVVDSLGPVGGDLHSDREYLHVPSLVERAKLTALLLMRGCPDDKLDQAWRSMSGWKVPDNPADVLRDIDLAVIAAREAP